MEASPHFTVSEPTAIAGSEIADVLHFPTDRISASPELSNPVVARKIVEIERTKHGVTTLEHFTLENGRVLEVVQGEPKTRLTDIPVVATTALATSIHGHNWHNMLHKMDLGMPTVWIGPEGGKMHMPRTPHQAKQFAQNLFSISLLEIASNMHSVLDETDDDGRYQPLEVINEGESRGDMALLAFNAIASQRGRKVAYSDGTAACFPSARKNLREHISLLPETLAQTSILGRLSLGGSLKRAAELPKTINPNPFFLAHVVATIPTLLSGSAGKFAEQLDPGTKMNQTLFVGDSWCNAKKWAEILNDNTYPGINIDLLPGNHMTIAHDSVIKARQQRMRNFRDELIAANHDSSKINWQNVHLNVRTATSDLAA